MKIKISKKQWEMLGKKAGWKKESQKSLLRGIFSHLMDLAKNNRPAFDKLVSTTKINGMTYQEMMEGERWNAIMEARNKKDIDWNQNEKALNNSLDSIMDAYSRGELSKEEYQRQMKGFSQ